MVGDGVSLNLVAFTSLINDYCFKAGNLEVALKLLEKMRECSLLPKVVIYTALIDGLCKRGECLLYKMLGVGVHPNYIDSNCRWLL